MWVSNWRESATSICTKPGQPEPAVTTLTMSVASHGFCYSRYSESDSFVDCQRLKKNSVALNENIINIRKKNGNVQLIQHKLIVHCKPMECVIYHLLKVQYIGILFEDIQQLI